MAQTFETIDYRTEDHIAFVTMNRPERGNAINYQMASELGQVWALVQSDSDVRVAILTGADDQAFTIGMDHDETRADQVLAKGSLSESPTGRMTPRRCKVWKPVIAAVNGECAGNGGLALIMDCDVIIASENATFFDNHVAWGSVIGTESTGLARRIPFGEVMRLVVTGGLDRMSARRAYEIGLVSEVVPQADLVQAARRLAAMVTRGAPLAVQGSVQVLWQGLEIPSRQAAIDNAVNVILRNQATDDFKEGQQARRAGHSPSWRGR